MADAATIPTDALVIGAGPVGLFQVFQLGLLEIQAHVVDALPYAGGQPVELYPDKPIYDIPAIAVCTGRELSERLLEQIRPFGATFHLGQEVTSVQRRDDGCFDVETSRGTRFLARTIFLAAGVGAFQPRLLRVDGLDRFRDTQLHYGVAAPQDFTGQHLVVVGGGDSALDWAIRFASDAQCQAASVTLVHRRDAFQAAPATIAKLRELRDAGRIRFVAGQITSHEEQEGRLAAAVVNDPDGQDIRLPLDHLLVFFGLSPKLGPIADWGLDIERKQVRVDTETFATSIPGIFAVGDINTYPGKKKLIVCGFHECVLAAYGAAAMVFPDKPVQLQYTTTSTRLHQVLGVQSPSAD